MFLSALMALDIIKYPINHFGVLNFIKMVSFVWMPEDSSLKNSFRLINKLLCVL